MNVYKKKTDLKMELSSLTVRANRMQKAVSENGPGNVAREITDNGFGGYILIEAKGDSMEKLIMDGAKIVVDTSDRAIVSGEIYALDVPWEGSIIRECRAEPKGLVLKPYNKNYPEVLLSWEEFDPQIVIGKVVCSILNVFR